MENYGELSSTEKNRYVYETVAYLRYSTSVESRIMLMINYLVALLGKGSSNKISIHHNFQDKKDSINSFERENKDIIKKLKAARNTVYAHMDPKQSDSKECIILKNFIILLYISNMAMHFKSFELA